MRPITALFMTMFLFFPCLVFADNKEIIAEGTYNMGDGETPSVAESRALLQAKKTALEQAGTYVESYSRVQNIKLTGDEIQVLASGLMKVEILDKKRTVAGDSINFWVRIRATVKPDNLEEMAKKVKEKSVVEDYRQIQAAYEESRKEIEELKKRLAKVTGEKEGVEARIIRAEKWFQANEWLDMGKHHWLNKQYDDAIVTSSVAILLNPNFADAYITRGVAYSDKGQQDRAIEDFNKAIGLDPDSSICYYDRGVSHYIQGEYAAALEDYSKAIILGPHDAEIYFNRGRTFYNLGRTNEAASDFQKACEMGSQAGCKNRRLTSQSK